MSKQRKDHDLDDFDDFDLDGEFDFGGEAGFDAADSPKGRNPVTRFIGSFKDGVKETLFKKETAKKLVENSLPHSYTVAIDSALDVASDARDTADKFKRETSKNINDIKTANRDELNAFADALPKGFGEKMKKWVATGKPSDVANVDQDQLALASSLAQVFGEAQNAQANQQQKETMSKLTDATASQNQMLANVNDVLFGIHKSVDRMVTYQDSIGVNFQRKMLETSLQQLFVSRKHLERVEKHYAFIEKAVPDIVQNTGLPDFVKINKAEMVQKEMASRFVGQMSDRLYASTAQIRQQVFRKLQGSLKEASQQLTGAAGMVASNASLFLGAGLDGGPADMVSQAGKMAGGYLAGKASEYAAKELKAMIKKNPELAKRVDDGDAFLQMLRARAPGYLNSKGLRGNTGNKYLDGAINYLGLDELSLRRNRTISKSLNGHLEDAAIFNLRTQRAITEVIPGLLSRIHLELHKANGGKETSPLQYDWSKGGFTTRKKYTDDLIKTRVATRENARELNDFESNFSKNFDPNNKLSGELKSKISRQMVLAGINGDDVSITEMIDPGSKNYIPSLAKHIKAEFGVEFEKGMSQDQRKAVMEMFKGGQKLMKLETELNNSRNQVAQRFKDPKGELLKLVAGEDISDFDQYSFIKKKSDGSLEFDYEAYFDYQRNNFAEGLGRDAYKKVGLRQINPYRVFSPGVTGARWDYAGRNQFGVQNRTSAVYSAPALARQAQSMNDPLVMPEDMQMQVNGVSMATVAPIANAIQRGFNRVFGEDDGVDAQGKPLSKRQQKRLAKAQGGLVGSMGGVERYLNTLVDNNKTQLDQLHDDLGEVVKAIQEIQVLSTVDPADRPGFIGKLADKAKSGGKKAWSFTKGYYNKMWGLTKWAGGKAKGVAGWGWGLAKKIPGLGLLGKLKDGVVGGAKGLAGLTATYYKTLFNLGIGSEEDPGLMRKAWRGGKKLFNRLKNGAMNWKLGIYLDGEEFPRLDMIGLKMGKFRDEQTGKVIKKLSDISGGNIIDAEGNVVITAEQLKNGLYNKFGERIDSKLKIGRGKLRDVLGFGWNLGKAVFKMPFKVLGWGLDKVRNAKLRLAKFAEDKNWGELLKFGSFSNSSRQLEETIKIRELLEKRLNPEAHWADEDGDGDRDGSYKDLMQRKAEAKDDKATEEKPKEEKKEKKESWFSRLLGGLGGLVGRLGPMIMAGVGMAAKLAIPALIAGWAIPKVFNWFKDDPIDPNDPRLDPNSPQYDPKLDPKSPEYSPSWSHRFGTWAEDKWNNAGLGTKAAVAGAAGLAMMHPIRTAKGVGWLGKKAWGAGKWAFDKWSDWRTAKGAVDVVKGAKTAATAANTAKNVATAANVASKVGTVAKVARGIRAAQGLAYLAGGAGKVALGSAAAAGKAALIGGLGAAKAAGAALMASPAAPFVLGAIAVGAVAYGGYKLWQRSKKRSESPMARLRMAGYGYEITDGDHVPKLLEVESILGRSLRKKNDGSYTVSDDVQRETILKIFNVPANDATAVQKWEKYFFYRFLPVYLSFVNALAKNNFSVDVTTMDDNLTYPQQRLIASDSIVTAEGLDPYSVMESGFGGERKVDLDREEVFDIYNSVGKLLDKNIRRGEANKRVKNRTAENERLDKELTKDEKKIKEALKRTGNGDASVEDLPVQRNGFGGSISKLVGGIKDAVKGAWDGLKSGFSWLGGKLGIGGDSNSSSGGNSFLDTLLGRNKPDPLVQHQANQQAMANVAVNGSGGVDMTGSPGVAPKNTVDFAKSFTKGLRIGNLTEAQTAAIAANTAETESGFRQDIVNKFGYTGLYQFGGQALADIGWMKKLGGKAGWKAYNNAMKNSANWLNGLSLEKFKASRELQDKAYVALANKNIQYGLGAAGSRKAQFQSKISDYRQLAKFLKMAHLKGAGNAVKGLLDGKDSKDGTGTSMIKYGDGAAAKVESILSSIGGKDAQISGSNTGSGGIANTSSSGTSKTTGTPAQAAKTITQAAGNTSSGGGSSYGANQTWEKPTYGNTNAGKAKANSGDYMFVGDSIANGFASAFGATTAYTKSGSQASYHVKNFIPTLLNNVSKYRKKYVILSMFTNNPTTTNLNHISDTLIKLKNAGLTANMLGVVNGYNWKNGYKWSIGDLKGKYIEGKSANNWLRNLCVQIGHRFLGGFTKSDGLGYHPASYQNLPGTPVTGATRINGTGKSGGTTTTTQSKDQQLATHQANQTAMGNAAVKAGGKSNPNVGDTRGNASGTPAESNTATGGDYPWMLAAKAELGVNRKSAPRRIEEYFRDGVGRKLPYTEKYCAAFVCWCLKKAGVDIGKGNAMASSFNNYGTPVDKSNPPYGSIMWVNFGGSRNHVAFSGGMNENGRIKMLGGNQSGKGSNDDQNGGNVSWSSVKPSVIQYAGFPSGYTPGQPGSNGVGGSFAAAAGGTIAAKKWTHKAVTSMKSLHGIAKAQPAKADDKDKGKTTGNANSKDTDPKKNDPKAKGNDKGKQTQGKTDPKQTDNKGKQQPAGAKSLHGGSGYDVLSSSGLSSTSGLLGNSFSSTSSSLGNSFANSLTGSSRDPFSSTTPISNRLTGKYAPWIYIAAKELGVNRYNKSFHKRIMSYFTEGAKFTQANPAKTSFCAAFVSWCLIKAGVSLNVYATSGDDLDKNCRGTVRAKNFNNFGKKVSTTAPPFGSIVYMNFGGEANHVAFSLGVKTPSGKVKTIGGNQSSPTGVGSANDGGWVTITAVKPSLFVYAGYPKGYEIPQFGNDYLQSNSIYTNRGAMMFAGGQSTGLLGDIAGLLGGNVSSSQSNVEYERYTTPDMEYTVNYNVDEDLEMRIAQQRALSQNGSNSVQVSTGTVPQPAPAQTSTSSGSDYFTVDDVIDGTKMAQNNPALAKQQTEIATQVNKQREQEYNQRTQVAKQEEITKQSEYDRSILNKQLIVQQDMLVELKGIRDEIKYLKVGGGMNPTVLANQVQQPKTEPVRPSAPDTILEPVSMGKL